MGFSKKALFLTSVIKCAGNSFILTATVISHSLTSFNPVSMHNQHSTAINRPQRNLFQLLEKHLFSFVIYLQPGKTRNPLGVLPVNTSSRLSRVFTVVFLLLLVSSCRTTEPVVTPEPVPYDPAEQNIREAVSDVLFHLYETEKPVRLATGVRLQRIELDDEAKAIHIYLNERFSYSPLRPDVNDAIHEMLVQRLDRRFRDYQVTLYSLGEPIDNLIPNYFRRSGDDFDFMRKPYMDEQRPRPVVRRHGDHIEPEHGLFGRQIALWHSHGWYYHQQKKRWEWQRPRLFQTVEDVLPMAFTIPYLIPMLENAGAHVWVPRERDLQHNEAIVDFEGSTGEGNIIINGSWNSDTPGFAIGSPPYADGINPFMQGSYRYIESGREGDSSVQWIADFPESGRYAVYISYVSLAGAPEDAFYSVYHRGGRTDFTVNQTVGGGTWVYLGHFEFEEGVNPDIGRVELINYSWRPSIVTADAVRFGGGMGIIAREGQTGGRPRYLEAARYYMQFAGMPDSLVYRLSEGRSDVVDDFQGRGEWVNYLKGAPFGPNADRNARGLGIPIDLSLSFQTDAGITRNDTVVGTLMIYSIEDGDSLRAFPDEISRLANRDFADIMQTGIVEDLRRSWDPAWTRRHLFNRMYSEAFRPNVPAGLLELLSHQNFLDMQFALDPRFRFDVSRTLYKSMLRFIAHRYQQEYVIQPLPVSNFRVFQSGENEITLRWQAVTDSLEASAWPDRFIVYKKTDDNPFDEGRVTVAPEFVFNGLEPGRMYQFKVEAANEGGKSFPSEIMAAGLAREQRRPVLVVNSFERISGPAIVDEPDFKGFANFLDPGVPDRFDISFTGDQFDFDPDSRWRTNDAPGHGASHADFETRILPGNRFDFPSFYGSALLELGIPFVSSSVASIRDRQVDMNQYDAVILILGMQKSTPWPKHEILEREQAFQVFPVRLRQEIERYLNLGGRLFVTGAYVGTDVEQRQEDDPEGMAFIRQVLHFENETNHAARTGSVRSVSGNLLPVNTRFSFNTGFHPAIYMVGAPDAIEPHGVPVEPGVSSRDDGGAHYPEDVRDTDLDGLSDDPAGIAPVLNFKATNLHYSDSMIFPGPYLNKEMQGDTKGFPSVRKEMVPSGPETLIRYEENQFSAGVGFRTEKRAVVTFGFPFETIIDPLERTLVLSGVMDYLGIPHHKHHMEQE